MFLDTPHIEECYLNLPNDSAVDSPLDMQTISEKQEEGTELVARRNKYKDLYFEKKLHCRVSAGSAYPEKGQQMLLSNYPCSEALP